MFKKIIIGFSVVVFVGLVTPVFLSPKFSMSRSIDIQAPVATVFLKLPDLNEYNKWNPFPEGDSTNQTDVSGLGIGSFLTWKGEKTGEGKMTIVEIDPDKSINIKMDFYSPMPGVGLSRWITVAKSDSTTEMTWTYEEDLNYFNRYFGLIMDAMMGKHFEKGLNNYKAILESPEVVENN